MLKIGEFSKLSMLTVKTLRFYEKEGLSRESYIDGIWNKQSVDEWLTEIQLPVE